MPYQIYRTEKLKHGGNIGASGAHMARSRPTANADPSIKNRIIVGTSDPAGDVSRLVPAKDARDAKGKLLRTAQSVQAIEIFIGTSPEWWDKATPEMAEDWVRSSAQWLAKEYGRDNIAHLQVHYDESTPHLTGFIVPLDENGRLNAKKWLGTRASLRRQQSECAKAVEHLGLERGIEGSQAQHQAVKRHYAQINRKIRPIKIDAPTLRDLFNPSAYADKQRLKAQKQASGLFARAKATESATTQAKGAVATSQRLAERNKQLERDLAAERRKSQAAELRSIPLPDVAQALGLEQDRNDKTIWRSSGGMKIGITSKDGASKFFDNASKKGGGGAIDLAMHAMATDYKGALSWLAANFGSDATSRDAALRVVEQAKRDVSLAQKERPAFTPPAPVEANWQHVKNWLISKRKLPENIVDRLHEKGDVYADDRRNAVFLARGPDGKPTGAELKGTLQSSKFSGMAAGSMKSNGAFQLGRITAKTIYLVESAIDAISLFVLRARGGEKSFCVMSAAGSSPTPPLGVTGAINDKQSTKVCAYDADAAGDQSAAAMTGWKRLRPAEGCDWNKMLQAQSGDEHATNDVSYQGPRL
jgi:hypothetical protein